MHTYRGPNGLIINHNGDCSGMAILRYQGTEIEVPAAEVAPYVEQERIVREIADTKELLLEAWGGDKGCRFCGGPEAGGWPAGVPTSIAHKPGCIYVRACEIVAQLDA